MSRVAVVAAQMAELEAFLGRRSALRERHADGLRYWCAECGRHEIAVAATGEGRRAGSLGAQRLLRAFEPAELIGVGVAGALSPGLEPGELLIAADVRVEDGAWLPCTLPSGADIAGARTAAVMTTDRIVCTPAERQTLWQSMDFEPVAVVDMESFDFVSQAREQGVEVAIIRCISDGADDRLPPWLNRCRRRDGTISRSRAAFRALGAPLWVPTLMRMRRRLGTASTALADALESLLQALA
jgi:adenosylhomocysteine nucleosidase